MPSILMAGVAKLPKSTLKGFWFEKLLTRLRILLLSLGQFAASGTDFPPAYSGVECEVRERVQVPAGTQNYSRDDGRLYAVRSP